MDLAALRNELLTDPANVGYAAPLAAGAYNTVADLLNTPRVDGFRILNSRELLLWVAAEARYARLETGAASDIGAIRSVCKAALLMLERSDAELDLRRADVSMFLGALQQAGIFTADDVTSLETLAAAQHGRAEAVCGSPAGIEDIVAAMQLE